MNHYLWIMARPARRSLPPNRASRIPFIVCDHCGWEWKGRRRMCPACLERTDAA